MQCHVEKYTNTTKSHLYKAYKNIRHIQIFIPEEFTLIFQYVQIFTHLRIYIKVTSKLNVLTFNHQNLNLNMNLSKAFEDWWMNIKTNKKNKLQKDEQNLVY
jgi:hypothetical protein